MKRGDDLYLILQSCTLSEARRFRKQLKRDAQNERQVALFDALREAPFYQKEAIAEIVGIAASSSSFASAKSRLREKVLKFLVEEDLNHRPDLKLQNQLSSIAVLTERGLHRLAINEIQKAKKRAISVDSLPELVRLLRMESRLIRILEDRDLASKLQDLHQQTKAAIIGLEREESLATKHDTLFLKARNTVDLRSPTQKTWLQAFIKEISKTPPPTGHFQDRRIYLQILILSQHLAGNQQMALQHELEMVSLWKEWPERILLEPEGVLKTFRSAMESAISTQEWEVFADLKSQMDNLHLPNPRLISKAKLISIYHQLNAMVIREQFSQLGGLIQDYQQWRKTHPEGANLNYQIPLHYHFFCACYMKGDFKIAETWRREMEATGHKAERKDIRHFARIGELLLWYQRQDSDMHESVLRTHQRFFSQWPESCRLELDFIALLQSDYLKNGLLRGNRPPPGLQNLLEEGKKRLDRLPLGWDLILWWVDQG